MRMLKGVSLMLVVVLASAAWGQDLMPKSEITGGYTYGSMDQNVGFGSVGRLNSNGWNTGATAFINRWLGIEGNIAGLSHSESASLTSGTTTVTGSASEKHYTFVFGPRVSFGQGRMSPFVHGLFGFDRMSLSSSGSVAGLSISADGTDTSLAAALGGGVEFGATKHLAVTTGFDYLMTRHGIPSAFLPVGVSGSSATQNNVRVSVGLAYHFGMGSGRPKR